MNRIRTSLLLTSFFLTLAPSILASTTWYVDGVNGSDGNECTLAQAACKTIGHAISLAASGDSIKVASATYPENLTIGFSLNVIGAGASTTIIDGQFAGRVITIPLSGTNPHVTLSDITIQNGLGGIYNQGTLTINYSTVSGNVVSVGALGGGIYNTGTLTISSSTLSGNSAHRGGGIFGGATFQNSILANNGGGNCYSIRGSSGYNLSSDSSCNFSNVGDLNNTDPKLGTLGSNGGPTQTIPLLSGSPAIDAGNPSGCTDGQGNLLKTDQRGMPRPDREDTGGCDMGAYESQSD